MREDNRYGQRQHWSVPNGFTYWQRWSWSRIETDDTIAILRDLAGLAVMVVRLKPVLGGVE